MKKLHLSLFVLCFSIVSISCINNTKEKFMPGISSNKLTDLNPSFKIKAEHLIEHLEQKGYNVRISQTFRSQERQDFIYNTYQKISNIINIDIRVTETTRSRHSHTRNGKPYACAIDLRPDGFYTIKERASFYITLRDELEWAYVQEQISKEKVLFMEDMVWGMILAIFQCTAVNKKKGKNESIYYG